MYDDENSMNMKKLHLEQMDLVDTLSKQRFTFFIQRLQTLFIISLNAFYVFPNFSNVYYICGLA